MLSVLFSFGKFPAKWEKFLVMVPYTQSNQKY